jgi:hypothetical protein
VSRFQFVADHRDTFEVKRLCEVIEVNRSSFYAWDAAAPARVERAADDARLAERIRVVHEADKAYGAPRVTAELNDGAPTREAGQPQAGRPGDGRARHRRDPAAQEGPDHRPRALRREGP